jgi:hypothetical protein
MSIIHDYLHQTPETGQTAMKTATKKKPAKAEDLAACAYADCYLRASHTVKVADKEKAEAKAALLGWLGDDLARVLPDGRTVQRTTSDFPAATIERKAYTSTTVTIAPPPAI